jgi:amino-acid N-acetyltransferase
MATETNDPDGHLAWFRNASPYIQAHRGATFVLAFGGEAIEEADFPALVHDIALLSRLGVRLVLVHGARPQIDARLTEAGIMPRYHDGLRITDSESLPLVVEAIGRARFTVEARLSSGLPNTPMAGAGIRVAGGNFVTARPWGVRDGVDFQHTGVVRRVDAEGLRATLDRGDIAVLSPLGYSATGETFNLHGEDVATEVAVALRADKLLFLMEHQGVADADGERVSQLEPGGADRWVADHGNSDPEGASHLVSAAKAIRRGVRRVHLIARTSGALLAELYTRDGTGTLVTAETYEGMRAGRIDDVGGIVELIRPLEEAGALVRRSREQLELEIERFAVIERDGPIIACAALYPMADGASAEIACVAVDPAYRGAGRGRQLLDWLEQRARARGLQRVLVLSTRSMHWFRERGYEPGDVDALPHDRRELYNWQRNSKVFIKELG